MQDKIFTQYGGAIVVFDDVQLRQRALELAIGAAKNVEMDDYIIHTADAFFKFMKSGELPVQDDEDNELSDE